MWSQTCGQLGEALETKSPIAAKEVSRGGYSGSLYKVPQVYQGPLPIDMELMDESGWDKAQSGADGRNMKHG